MSKYGVTSGPYFQSEYRNYGPKITPYLDAFTQCVFELSES